MINLTLTTHNKERCYTIISPWSVEFDEGESFGYSLLKVVLIQDQNTGLQKEDRNTSWNYMDPCFSSPWRHYCIIIFIILLLE